MEQITIEQMKTLNRLSGFCLSDEALQQEKASLEELLECFEVLHGLDTDGITPEVHLFPHKNVLREDVVKEFCPVEEMIKNAPSWKNGAFVVPATRKKQGSLK